MAKNAPASGDWPPSDHLTKKDPPPPWQKAAVIAAVTAGVGLLGVVIVKKRTGKTNEELQEDVRVAGDKAKQTGKDVWGFSKEKASEAADKLPGTAAHMAEDIKLAGAQGTKDLKKGARAVTRKANDLFEEEAKPNYGILGWRHVFNNPKMGKKGHASA